MGDPYTVYPPAYGGQAPIDSGTGRPYVPIEERGYDPTQPYGGAGDASVSGTGGGGFDFSKLLPFIGAGVSALGGYYGTRQSNAAIQHREDLLRRLSSPAYFLSVLSQIHPALRAQVAATYGPAVQQALDRAAAFLGPSGAGAALTTAASLAPETAAYNAAYGLAGDIQRNALSAISGTPIPGTTNPLIAGVTGGVRSFLSITEAQRLAKQQNLNTASQIGTNAIAPLAPVPRPGAGSDTYDLPEEPLFPNAAPLLPSNYYRGM